MCETEYTVSVCDFFFLAFYYGRYVYVVCIHLSLSLSRFRVIHSLKAETDVSDIFKAVLTCETLLFFPLQLNRHTHTHTRTHTHSLTHTGLSLSTISSVSLYGVYPIKVAKTQE